MASLIYFSNHHSVGKIYEKNYQILIFDFTYCKNCVFVVCSGMDILLLNRPKNRSAKSSGLINVF